MSELNKELMQRYAALDQQFRPFETLYKDVADYLMPSHGAFLDRGDPAQAANINRYSNIINDTGVRASHILGAG